MADYDLGTARGKIDIDGEGAVTGFGKADAAQQKFSRGAKVAGGIIATAGVGIAAGLGLAINSAANFEQRMSAVEAVSGATGKELDKLRDLALQLGADTKFSATEAASAIEELVKAGIPVEDVLNGAADAAVNLAAAGEIDLAQAATIAANALNVFNLRGEDMEHVADLIAGAANASAIDVGEFGLSLQQAGATASLVGLSFDDLTLAIAAMGNAGIKGSDAGTSLKTFMANLQPVTEKQIALFKDLGLLTEDMGNQFFDAQGKIKPMREIAETLQNALAGMTDQQKALALETLFGSDAIRAASIIAGEGAEGFDELAASIGKVSAEDVAETRMDNLKGSIEQLKGSVETLAIRFGTPLLNAIRGVVDFLTGLANKFSELSPGMQKAIGIILAIVSAFLILGGTILLVVGWFGTVATAVGLSIGALAGVIGIAFGVIAVIALLVAGIVLLYKENETFRNIVQGVWDWIKDTIPPIVETIMNGIRGLIEAFKGEGITSDGFVGVMERIGVVARAVFDWIVNVGIPAVVDAWNWFADQVGTVVDFITGTVIPAIQWLASEIRERLESAIGWLQENVFPVFTALGELIAGAVRLIIGVLTLMEPIFRAVWSVIVTVVSTAIDVIKAIIEGFINTIIILWNNFGSILWGAIQTAWNLIVGIVQGALQTLKGIIQLLTGIITLDWSKAWEGIKNIFGGVWETIKAIVTAAIEFVKLAIETVIAVIKTIWEVGWEAIKVAVEVVWEVIKGAVEAAITFIVGLIEAQLNLLKAIWEAIWNAVSSTVSSIWETVKSTVSSAISAVVGFIAAIPGSIASALSSLASTLWNLASGAMTSFLDAINSGITSVLTTIAGLPQRIIYAIGNVGSILYQAGKNVIQGFIDGIGSMIGSVRDKLGSITSSLTSWKGPPRKDRVILEPVGELVMEGFIRGIANQIGPLRSLLADIGPDIGERLSVAGASSPMATTNNNSSTVTLEFNFPNVGSAEDAAEIERVIKSSDVMDAILSSLRAGRRIN